MPARVTPKNNDSTDSQQREIDALREQTTALTQQVTTLTEKLDWFKRQVFGEKSEKRFIDPQIQPDLLAGEVGSTPPITENAAPLRQLI